jgi:hypothetical protein
MMSAIRDSSDVKGNKRVRTGGVSASVAKAEK